MPVAEPLAARRRVVIGDVDPLVRVALLCGWDRALDVRLSTLRGWELLASARQLGAVAAVSTREDVALIYQAIGSGVVLVGASPSSSDVLLCSACGIEHLENPGPGRLWEAVELRARRVDR